MCGPIEMDYVELGQAATCSGVSEGVVLIHVTGDLGPLLSSLACSELTLYNMELDQPATSSLVWALQHGVEDRVVNEPSPCHAFSQNFLSSPSVTFCVW